MIMPKGKTIQVRPQINLDRVHLVSLSKVRTLKSCLQKRAKRRRKEAPKLQLPLAEGAPGQRPPDRTLLLRPRIREKGARVMLARSNRPQKEPKLKKLATREKERMNRLQMPVRPKSARELLTRRVSRRLPPDQAHHPRLKEATTWQLERASKSCWAAPLDLCH